VSPRVTTFMIGLTRCDTEICEKPIAAASFASLASCAG
jgi:hypothetical protein